MESVVHASRLRFSRVARPVSSVSMKGSMLQPCGYMFEADGAGVWLSQALTPVEIASSPWFATHGQGRFCGIQATVGVWVGSTLVTEDTNCTELLRVFFLLFLLLIQEQNKNLTHSESHCWKQPAPCSEEWSASPTHYPNLRPFRVLVDFQFPSIYILTLTDQWGLLLN